MFLVGLLTGLRACCSSFFQSQRAAAIAATAAAAAAVVVAVPVALAAVHRIWVGDCNIGHRHIPTNVAVVVIVKRAHVQNNLVPRCIPVRCCYIHMPSPPPPPFPPLWRSACGRGEHQRTNRLSTVTTTWVSQFPRTICSARPVSSTLPAHTHVPVRTHAHKKRHPKADHIHTFVHSQPLSRPPARSSVCSHLAHFHLARPGGKVQRGGRLVDVILRAANICEHQHL